MTTRVSYSLLQAFTQPFSGAVPRNAQEKMRDTVSVKDCGAQGVGTDDTAAFVKAEAGTSVVPYVVPPGTYGFSGSSLDVTKILSAPRTAVLDSAITGDAFARARDRSGTLIGVQHNHLLQKTYSGGYPRAGAGAYVTSGSLVAPPVSAAAPPSGADIMAHWYGDWGLDWYRQQGSAPDVRFDNWYDGAWNWDTNATATPDHGIYDPQRASVMGHYRNDDANAVDWQCYWLREAGVRAVCPVAFNLVPVTMSQTTDRNFWIWQLLNAPNMQGMSYVPWAQTTDVNDPDGPVTASQALLTGQWQNLWAQLAFAFPNNFVLRHAGKRWFTVYAWNMERFRQVFDAGSAGTNTLAFLAARATEVRALGYDGLCVLANTAISNTILSQSALLAANVLHLQSYYGGAQDSGTPTTYTDVVTNYAPPTSDRVLNISTALKSVAPASTFSLAGSTPRQFWHLTLKALKHLQKNPSLPQLLTVYNVSEWAAGGPGLHPNKVDGWGYLDALRLAASTFAANASVASGVVLTDPTGTFTLPETASLGAVFGTLVGINPSATLGLVDSDSGRVALSGLNVVRGAAVLDYETHPLVTFSVQQALGGYTLVTLLTANVTDVAEALPLSHLTGTFVLPENAPLNAVWGILGNINPGVTLTLANDGFGAMTLSGANILRGPTVLDFETAPTVDFAVTQTRGAEVLTTTFTATVTDVVEAAPLTHLTGTFTLPENALEGALWGMLGNVNPGVTLSLASDGSGAMALSGTSILRGPTVLDFETLPNVAFSVTQTRGAEVLTTNFVGVVTDVAEGGALAVANYAPNYRYKRGTVFSVAQHITGGTPAYSVVTMSGVLPPAAAAAASGADYILSGVAA